MRVVAKSMIYPSFEISEGVSNESYAVRFGEHYYVFQHTFTQSDIGLAKSVGAKIFVTDEAYDAWLRGEREEGDSVEGIEFPKTRDVYIPKNEPLPELNVEFQSVMVEVEKAEKVIIERDEKHKEEVQKLREEVELCWKVAHDIVSAYKEVALQNEKLSENLVSAVAQLRGADAALRHENNVLEHRIKKLEITFWEKVKQKCAEFVLKFYKF